MWGMSIIVPCYNEEETINLFCNKIDEYAFLLSFDLELCFVDDGSNDNTVKILQNYEFENINKTQIIKLSKNYGSHAAIRAGISKASFKICTWMGSDLQEPIEFINLAWQKIRKGYDAVYIEKENIKVAVRERLFSKVYSCLMRKYAVTSYANGGISTIVFNGKIKANVNDNIESNSSIMLQIMNMGYKYCTVALPFNERSAGRSKWTLTKKVKLFIDSFVSFSFAPIRLVSIVGAVLFICGLIFGMAIIINKIFVGAESVPGYATIASLLAVGFGITNISLGIIAEYLWRTLDAAKGRPVFHISEIYKGDPRKDEK